MALDTASGARWRWWMSRSRQLPMGWEIMDTRAMGEEADLLRVASGRPRRFIAHAEYTSRYSAAVAAAAAHAWLPVALSVRCAAAWERAAQVSTPPLTLAHVMHPRRHAYARTGHGADVITVSGELRRCDLMSSRETFAIIKGWWGSCGPRGGEPRQECLDLVGELALPQKKTRERWRARIPLYRSVPNDALHAISHSDPQVSSHCPGAQAKGQPRTHAAATATHTFSLRGGLPRRSSPTSAVYISFLRTQRARQRRGHHHHRGGITAAQAAPPHTPPPPLTLRAVVPPQARACAG